MRFLTTHHAHWNRILTSTSYPTVLHPLRSRAGEAVVAVLSWRHLLGVFCREVGSWHYFHGLEGTFYMIRPLLQTPRERTRFSANLSFAADETSEPRGKQSAKRRDCSIRHRIHPGPPRIAYKLPLHSSTQLLDPARSASFAFLPSPLHLVSSQQHQHTMQLNHMTRTLRTAAPMRTFTTCSLRLSSSPAPAAAVDASAESAAAGPPPKLLSYYVPRTAGGELPVYGDVKGMRYETICRKVDGNVEVGSPAELAGRQYADLE